MKTNDVDILIVPDTGDAPPDHWQARWVRSLKTARKIEQADWSAPDILVWSDVIVAAARRQTRPAVVVAHGLGVLAVAHAAERLGATGVVGAFLVAPVDVVPGLPPPPAERLPWPAVVVASSNDPLCSVERARDLAQQWGAAFTEAGEAGHLDVASGHGPWPDGLLRFGQFLRELG